MQPVFHVYKIGEFFILPPNLYMTPLIKEFHENLSTVLTVTNSDGSTFLRWLRMNPVNQVRRVYVYVCIHPSQRIVQGGPKMAHFWYALTSLNTNRFLKLFHCQNQEKMCNNTVTKGPTTPQVCRSSVVGSSVIVLLHICSWFWQWNNFENRLIFDEVKAYHFLATLYVRWVHKK